MEQLKPLEWDDVFTIHTLYEYLKRKNLLKLYIQLGSESPTQRIMIDVAREEIYRSHNSKNAKNEN